MEFSAYLICATPRSGSTLLCDLLKQTGVAGQPDSFYRSQSIAEYVEYFGIAPGEGIDFERRYLTAVVKEGTGATGRFGMRLNGPTLFELIHRLQQLFPRQSSDAARVTPAFGTTLYIHLQRRDRIAQAISRAKAEQSGLWHRHVDGGERERVKPHVAPTYDAARLEAFVDEVDDHESRWRTWSKAQGIVPLEVSYEDLAEDPAGTLGPILAALDRDPAIAAAVAPQTARLADADSLQWAERYRAETAR